VHARSVTVEMRSRPKILCDAIGPGTLTIVLGPRARVVNPAKAGRYRVLARKGSLTFSAPLTISR
jgi:hypothetical protein